MAIIGAHMLLYSPEADAVRAVFRDVFKFTPVDAGGGWLIFALPPAELGIHPAEGTGADGVQHKLSLMCDDIHATVDDLEAKGVEFVQAIRDDGFGLTAAFVIPGGPEMMIYEPRHPTAYNID